jgi:hypothetical protein
MSTTARSQVDNIRRQLDETTTRLEHMAARAGAARWQERPGAAAWSASECVQHLVTTIDAFLPRIDAALAQATPRAGDMDAPFRQSPIGRLFVRFLEPPYRLRAKAGGPFVPETSRPPEIDLAEFTARHAELHVRLDRAAAYPLDRLTLQSPFFERLRYTLYTTFLLIPAHERRHIWQAEQALAALARR